MFDRLFKIIFTLLFAICLNLNAKEYIAEIREIESAPQEISPLLKKLDENKEQYKGAFSLSLLSNVSAQTRNKIKVGKVIRSGKTKNGIFEKSFCDPITVNREHTDIGKNIILRVKETEPDKVHIDVKLLTTWLKTTISEEPEENKQKQFTKMQKAEANSPKKLCLVILI